MNKKSTPGVCLPNLQAWRRWTGLSQVELGIRAGVTPSSIVEIEHGRVARFTTVGKLADALGISRQALMHSLPKNDEVAV